MSILRVLALLFRSLIHFELLNICVSGYPVVPALFDKKTFFVLNCLDTLVANKWIICVRVNF